MVATAGNKDSGTQTSELLWPDPRRVSEADFPVICWPQYYFHRHVFVLPGSSGLSEAEEAEIETIRQHRQELLEDIKVRTILFLLSA